MNPAQRALRRLARSVVDALAHAVAEVVADVVIRRLGLENEEENKPE